MSALEALAAGIPILVSEHVPVRHWAEIMGVGKVSSCNPEAFASSIRQLLLSPERLVSMGKRGRNLVERHFEMSVVSRLMLRQCESIATIGHPLIDLN